MTGRIVVAVLLTLVQAGLLRGTSTPFIVPNLPVAYLIAESTRLDAQAAGWLALAVGFSQGLALTAPIGAEPMIVTMLGCFAAVIYRNPLHSRIIIPFTFCLGMVLAYEALTSAAAWIRWGYPAMPLAALGQRWPEVVLTAALATGMVVAFGRRRALDRG